MENSYYEGTIEYNILPTLEIDLLEGFRTNNERDDPFSLDIPQL
jgi:hypothetical protein